MLRIVISTILLSSLVATHAVAQQRTPEPTSGITIEQENALAVATSGVWLFDGEFRTGTSGFYKLTGAFSLVMSTSESRDEGDYGVMALYLEPMSGGPSLWWGGRTQCVVRPDLDGTGCITIEGASGLLDLNVWIDGLLVRGEEASGEFREPSDPKADDRFATRSSSRGRFRLRPMK